MLLCNSLISIHLLELGIEHFVGEATHGNPNSLKHTIASQLVHDEWGLHISGLLVGVGHKATHKVGVAAVQGLSTQVSFI